MLLDEARKEGSLGFFVGSSSDSREEEEKVIVEDRLLGAQCLEHPGGGLRIRVAQGQRRGEPLTGTLQVRLRIGRLSGPRRCGRANRCEQSEGSQP